MNPGRSQSLVRVLRLMRRVEGHDCCDLRTLAREFGVHPRTIRRDLQALAEAGVRVPLLSTTRRASHMARASLRSGADASVAGGSR